jgi:hypothetical protein
MSRSHLAASFLAFAIFSCALSSHGLGARQPAKSTPPTIKHIVPPTATVKTSVTISGQNFGNEEGSVTFNGAKGDVTSWSDLKIEVTIPMSASDGDVVVTLPTKAGQEAATAKKAGYKIAPSACGGETLELHFLTPSDAGQLIEILASLFAGMRVQATSTGGRNPFGGICVILQAAQQPIPDCDETSLTGFCGMQRFVKLVDADAFKDGKLNWTYLVSLRSPLARKIGEVIRHPAPGLDLRVANDAYVILIPAPPTVGQAAKSGSDLAPVLAGVRSDVQSIDELFAGAIADNARRQDLVNDPMMPGYQVCQDYPALSQLCRNAQVKAERWLASHTIRFSYLGPRDVALALADIPDWKFQVRSLGQAISILPNAQQLNDSGIYLAADAVERDLLYHQKLTEDKAAAQSGGGDSKPSATPANMITTHTSTTTTQPAQPGKASAPPVMTIVDSVTTTTQPASPPPTDGPAGGGQPTTSKTGNTPTAEAAPQVANAVANKGGSDGGDIGGSKSGGTNPKTPAPGNPGGSGAQTAGAKAASSPHPLHFDNVVRLYHLRQADKIAEAINAASPKDDPLVQALDDKGNNDLLLILPPSGATDHGMDIKRAIAMLDLPRPQLSLQAWSYQVSERLKKTNPSPTEKAQVSKHIQDAFDDIRDAVFTGNDNMKAALEHGVGNIYDSIPANNNIRNTFFEETFYNYLTERYQHCISRDSYCLGYFDALSVPQGQPGNGAADASLSRLLLLLLAAREPQIRVHGIIQAMQGGEVDPSTYSACHFEEKGDGKKKINWSNHIPFPLFQAELEALVTPRNVHIVRAAILDFLFEYKWTIVYPNDFIPYLLQRNALVVDSLLNPLTVAFNEDVDSYVRKELECVEEKRRSEKSTGLSAFGSVQVSAISGTKASVDGKVNNYFDITPPMSLNDILNGSNQQNVATSLKNILTPKEILMVQALANIGTQPRITAEVTKGTKLSITPTTLDTASSAELDIDFDVNEPSPPATVNQKSSTKDLLDRVADYHVSSHVRVDSLKLFQVSAFTMELTHPERGIPVPVIGQIWEGIFGTMPGVDKLFRLPPYASTVDNRSIAIVRALVVPTAMDLGLSLGFAADRVEDPVTGSSDPLNSVAQAGGKLRGFHTELVKCVLRGNDDCLTPGSRNRVRLSTTPEDYRDPTTP